MRMPLPSDLSAEDLEAATSGMREGLVEEFVILPEGQNIGYLELDLRPDYRYLYWTVPGEESEPDGQVRQMARIMQPSTGSYQATQSGF